MTVSLSYSFHFLPSNGRRRKLAPYAHFIVALRLQGASWPTIQAWLNEQYGVVVRSWSIAQYFARIESSGKLNSISPAKLNELFELLDAATHPPPRSHIDQTRTSSLETDTVRFIDHTQEIAPATPTFPAAVPAQWTDPAPSSAMTATASGGQRKKGGIVRFDFKSPEFQAARAAARQSPSEAFKWPPSVSPASSDQPENQED